MSRVFIHVQYLKGIGHLTRAGLIAEAAARRGLDVHLVSGGLPLPGFAPRGITLHQLPALQAGPGGFADLRDEAGEPVDDAWRVRRAEATLALFEKLAPDVLVIETFPFGRRMLGLELIALLEAAKTRHPQPIVLCSVRDILQQSRKPGRAAESVARLRQYVDAVMVHGDPRFAALEETFPAADAIGDMLRYTGFVTAGGGRPATAPGTVRADVIVSAGGGAVGPALAEAALAARASTALKNAPWRIITGPHLPVDDFERLRAKADDGVVVERFRTDFRALLAGARLSVSYAGYNTVCDMMGTGTPAVLVSYGGETGGETEQACRAARCEALGLGVALADDALSPESVANAIARALSLPRPQRVDFDLGGAARAAEIIAGYAARATSGRSA